ncbi:hypothetical protein LJC36_00565 [Desulfovibrio sp. OttesenSCG-928-C14]|nr:hypothetical protein [Desulfovibrio sp. OttesenSCG-928-C14]
MPQFSIYLIDIIDNRCAVVVQFLTGMRQGRNFPARNFLDGMPQLALRRESPLILWM